MSAQPADPAPSASGIAPAALPTSTHGFGYSAPYREQSRYERLFPQLPPAPDAGEAAAAALAATMVDNAGAGGGGGWPAPGAAGDNSDLPAGWTYFGQFVDHDLTFDPVSTLTSAQTADADLLDLRTARFDLDSLYGRGPDDEPFLYDQTNPAKLLVVPMPGESGAFDLPRNSQQRALVGDPRNDVHVIISQLHLAFARFHNAVVDRIAAKSGAPTGAALFAQAQREVLWHYQWLVVHEYLDHLVGQNLRQQVLADAQPAPAGQQGVAAQVHLRYFLPTPGFAYIPFEFSAAAFRFGHSQVRPAYKLNAAIPPLPIFDGTPTPGTGDLRGFRQRTGGWTIDWSLFFAGAPSPTGTPSGQPQPSRSIDTHLAPALTTLPATVVTDGGPNNLALRNLRRGTVLGLPSGQAVAQLLGVTPLSQPAASLAGGTVSVPDPCPLWFYILAEAEAGGGSRLGSVGALIVTETLVGLLAADDSSWLRQNPMWTPTLGATPGQFTIVDLLTVAATGT